jgi:prepilin-type N-terminal cleavage/methylation domain-containing protein
MNMKKKAAGFSLLELMIVCVILVIVSAIAVPNIMQANANYKLDAAGHSVASLLQQARMQAVKTNQPQYVQYDATGTLAFVNDGSTTTYATGNPDVGLAGALSIPAAAPASSLHVQLDTYIGGAIAPQVGGIIAFNARGLPCTAAGNTCPSATSGFEWFIQNGNGSWEAVTVTPAGRIKSWRLSKATNGNATCGYAACWQ